jgi:hypothetical protein
LTFVPDFAQIIGLAEIWRLYRAISLRERLERDRGQPKSANVGGARRDRTADLIIANDALSQLSYGPIATASWAKQRPATGAI